MTEVAKIKRGDPVQAEKPNGLALLRVPFAPNQISKLPKPTKRQTEEVRADFKKGIRCKLCGQWHHKDVVHLDYVGHAALTDRLLDCDPAWNWEPVATDEHGLPLIDANGGMWIRLTVCGQTRLGYGHADGKRGGDAIKEVIGDAMRNAAMRFGAALDLWHKGDLHPADEQDDQPQKDNGSVAARDDAPPPEHIRDQMKAAIESCRTLQQLSDMWSDKAFRADLLALPPPMKAEISTVKDRIKSDLNKQTSLEDIGDEIPY